MVFLLPQDNRFLLLFLACMLEVFLIYVLQVYFYNLFVIDFEGIVNYVINVPGNYLLNYEYITDSYRNLQTLHKGNWIANIHALDLRLSKRTYY